MCANVVILPQFYIQLKYKANISFTLRIQIMKVAGRHGNLIFSCLLFVLFEKNLHYHGILIGTCLFFKQHYGRFLDPFVHLLACSGTLPILNTFSDLSLPYY